MKTETAQTLIGSEMDTLKFLQDAFSENYQSSFSETR